MGQTGLAVFGPDLTHLMSRRTNRVRRSGKNNFAKSSAMDSKPGFHQAGILSCPAMKLSDAETGCARATISETLAV